MDLNDLAAWADQTAARLDEADFSEPLREAAQLASEDIRSQWQAQGRGRSGRSGRAWDPEKFIRSAGPEQVELVFASNNPSPTAVSDETAAQIVERIGEAAGRLLE